MNFEVKKRRVCDYIQCFISYIRILMNDGIRNIMSNFHFHNNVKPMAAEDRFEKVCLTNQHVCFNSVQNVRNPITRAYITFMRFYRIQLQDVFWTSVVGILNHLCPKKVLFLGNCDNATLGWFWY